MSIEGILFFGSIIISYFVGMWAGMKIEKQKIIVKQPKDEKKVDIKPTITRRRR